MKNDSKEERDLLTNSLILIGISLYIVLCFTHQIGWSQEKIYSRDFFCFIVGIIFISSISSIHRLQPFRKPDLDLPLNEYDPLPMNRNQTEEWKGWMQILFLLYHYFNAKEIYPYIRVLVSSYVFLTGFGNFLYFKKRKDFSFLRIMAMYWRLNFSCFLLMILTGNGYMLYYIVPLHTLHFTLIYILMRIFSEYNTFWWVHLKIIIGFIFIFIVWNCGLFIPIFTPFKFIFQLNGSLHEWYFRTNLDKFSSLYGMIFALYLPYFNKGLLYLSNLEWKKKIITTTTLILLCCGSFVFWYIFFTKGKDKYEYNENHPYICWIPILGYLALRNSTKTLRQFNNSLFQTFGTTTLETYLLQFHIYLSDNAKTQFCILPKEYPLMNFLLLGIIYIICANRLLHITLKLRTIFLGI